MRAIEYRVLTYEERGSFDKNVLLPFTGAGGKEEKDFVIQRAIAIAYKEGDTSKLNLISDLLGPGFEEENKILPTDN